jgi:3-deoxy-manno-octulosonate cytidylyltransferase (CMP-KDO synthetase)
MRSSGEPQDPTGALGVIPARYGSTRLPGKPLVPLAGKPLVQHIWDRAILARSLSGLVVATDDERIARVVAGFGGRALMTSTSHPSGTDRLAEVARALPAAIYVNIQGDEPLLDAADVDALVEGLRADPGLSMATLASPLGDPKAAEDPNIVKVVCDASGRALYFSRCPIPYPRHGKAPAPAGSDPWPTRGRWLRHIGLYAYRHDFLLEFASWEPSALERTEGLEQLRALERGRAIQVFPARGRYVGVDTPEDLITARNALEACS